nr:PREDICTED: uncharacterized protein LOC108953037 isoform X4 [Musa acuminata subsp. malaccensis]
MPRRDGRNAQWQQQPGFGQTVAGILLMALLSYFAMKFFGPKRPAELFQLISNLFHKGDSLWEEKDTSCLQQYAIAFDEKALHQFSCH